MRIPTIVLKALSRVATVQPTNLHHMVAAATIDRESWTGDRSRAADALASELALHATKVLDRVRRAAEGKPDGPLTPLDREVTADLAELGPEGKSARKRIVANVDPASPMRLWMRDAEYPPFRFINTLALVLWRDVVRPRLERERQPALSIAVVEVNRRTLWSRRAQIDDLPNGAAVVVDREGQVRARITSGALSAPALDGEIAADVLRATASLTGHRLVRWLVATGYKQAADPTTRDPSMIAVAGGFAALARELGLSAGKAANELADAVRALQHVHIELPGQRFGGLLLWSHQDEAPGMPAVLRIRLGDPMLPDYVTLLPKHPQSMRDARKLVPIPLRLPPLVGRPREHAAQASLQMGIMVELRRAALELATDGSIAIPDARWRELADEAGLPRTILAEVIEGWLKGNHTAAPFLTRPKPGAYTLATPTYAGELWMLREAGAASSRARENSRRRRSRRRTR